MTGQSGRTYAIDRVLQDRGPPFGRVYLAKNGGSKYVLKEIPKYNYQTRLNIYNILGRRTQHIRLLEDTVKENATFVHKYFNDNLLALVRKTLPLPVTKKILKDVLRGLADLHEVDIVHNDVKADNILIDTEETETEIKVLRTHLADLEGAAHVLPQNAIRGLQVGNWMWRSPEAHAEGPIEKPSDIFSFGIVYLGDNPWVEVYVILMGEFNKDTNPRYPFRLWEHDAIDEDFRDLIGGLTNFDPTKRLTAQEALRHRWFQDI
ncbi:MAG: hypothetical protein Q9227_007373 [Pyrenula ochraceoflavens]